MKDILNNFISTKETNGLLVFEMPTGFGKTTKVCEYICDFLNKNLAKEPKKIFYITPLKKNVNDVYQKVKEILNNDQLFNDEVLLLTSNCENVIEKINKVEIKGNFANLRSFKELKNKINNYNDSKIILDDSSLSNEFESQIREKYEPAFRNDIEKEISKWEEKTYEDRLNKVKKEYTWMLDLYPSILTRNRRVIITTLDKFYYGNNPIIEKGYRFITNSIIDSSMIFIDESDSCKNVLLNNMIEDCNSYKINLIKLISNIHNFINNEELPAQLFNQLNVTDAEKTTKRSYEKLVDKINKCFIKNNLIYQFKMEDEDTNKTFLFHDSTNTIIIENKEERFIKIKRDDKNKINYLSKTNEQDLTFNSFIRSLHGVMNYFITFCNIASKNYLNYYNYTHANKMEISDAITSILHGFKLHDDDVKTIEKLVTNNLSNSGNSIKHHLLHYELYEEGFEYYCFENNPSHEFNTDIKLSFLNDTPEKFLKRLIEKSFVVLMSATAEIQSTLRNFDLTYLGKSSNAVYAISNYDKQRLKLEYDSIKCRNHTIKIEECNVCDNDEELYKYFDLSDSQLEKFNLVLDNYKKEKELYEFKRVLKILIAIKHFILSDKRVLLVMRNKILKEKNEKLELYNLETINKVIDIMCEKKYKKPEIISLSSKDFENKKEKYKEYINSGEKVVLFTSYPTASTGQNLQYTINENEKDIDSIYLELPTNIVNKVDSTSSENDVLKYCYQMLSLRRNGEISYNYCKKCIKYSLSNIKKGIEDDNYYKSNEEYRTNSVNNCAVAIIKQSIGRINRTRDQEIKNTQIYLDSELVKKISFSSENINLQTKEMNQIIDYVKNDRILEPEDKLSLLQSINKDIEFNKKTISFLHKNFGHWDFDSLKKWNELREFVLRYPTISNEELKNPNYTDYSDLYLKAPKNIKISHYYANANEYGNNFRIKYQIAIKNEEDKDLIEINDRYTSLDKIRKINFLSKYFNEYNVPLIFQHNDYILLPSVFKNIYMGALGEFTGRCVFEREKIPLIEITDKSKYEMFDYIVKSNNDIYIDFKNWSQNTPIIDKENYRKKTLNKLNEINGKKAIIVNLFSSSNYKECISENKKILEVPRLFINDHIDYDMIDKIRDFINDEN